MNQSLLTERINLKRMRRPGAKEILHFPHAMYISADSNRESSTIVVYGLHRARKSRSIFRGADSTIGETTDPPPPPDTADARPKYRRLRRRGYGRMGPLGSEKRQKRPTTISVFHRLGGSIGGSFFPGSTHLNT